MEYIEVAGKRINAIIQTCNNTNIFILQSCQARIQEFLSGGFQLSEKFWQAKKKKRKKTWKGQKTEGLVVLSILKKYGLKRLSIQINWR